MKFCVSESKDQDEQFEVVSLYVNKTTGSQIVARGISIVLAVRGLLNTAFYLKWRKWDSNMVPASFGSPYGRVCVKKKTTRVQIELPEQSFNRLSRLKDMTESTSYAEVAKNSFRLYEKMIRYVETDHTIFVKGPDGSVKELDLFM